MKTVMVMFDTLSRRFLSVYGNNWVHTPNFERLVQKSTLFSHFYAGSVPCMPARRELHTGRYNFLHRSWGPLEPFDFSMIEALKTKGIYTHLVTDHSHYWEDGGSTYHSRYNTWEGFRGQEGDRWVPIVDSNKLDIPSQSNTNKKGISLYHNYANRTKQTSEEEMSSVKTVMAGVDFINKFHDSDNWLLQIECFDPHEPFIVPNKYLDLYQDDYIGDVFDWPPMAPITEETEEQKKHIIKRYAALISMCDAYLGKVLDKFDEYDLWKDTLLIVNTDHGFLMGEHNWYGKNLQPVYNEVSHLPFFMYDPRHNGPSIDLGLSRTIDIAPTILDFFKVDIPEQVLGTPLNQNKETQTALFGNFGAHVNITDSDFVYMRSPINKSNQPLNEYTLMPTHMRGFFNEKSLKKASLFNEFQFTKGIPVLKIPSTAFISGYKFGNKLFNQKTDYNQINNIDDITIELKMIEKLRVAMLEAEAPHEQFLRIGINKDRAMTAEELFQQRLERETDKLIDVNFETTPLQKAKIRYVRDLVPIENAKQVMEMISSQVNSGIAVDTAVVQVLTQMLSMRNMPKEYLGMLISSLEYADKED